MLLLAEMVLHCVGLQCLRQFAVQLVGIFSESAAPADAVAPAVVVIT